MHSQGRELAKNVDLKLSQEITEHNVAQINDLVIKLKSVDPAAFAKDASIALKIKKLKYRLALPLCAEQVLSVLLVLLSLKHDHKIFIADLIPDADEKHCFNLLINAILPLLRKEKKESEPVYENIESCLETYFRRANEQTLYKALADIYKEYISCIDIDYVMDDAATLRATQAKTLDKNAIVLLGKSGAGKSFLINYLLCESMFSRVHVLGNIKSVFSKADGKIEIDYKKQPEALKAIKIGGEAVSETFAMGVAAIDDGTSKGLDKFKGKDYVLCDTPGAGDNRHLFGEEQKLVNALQTVVPLYQAKSARFVVLLSSGAADMRGDNFRETIEYVASMFTSSASVSLAARSMIFAITGDEGYDKVKQFKQQLKSFLENKKTLNINDKTEALLEILQQRFDTNDVHFIRPFKAHSANPESLMRAIENCEPLSPRFMTPFAETTVVDLVKSETAMVTNTIMQILDSLEHEMPAAMLEAQLLRLTNKFKKLCFMDAYYSFAKVQLEPVFKRLILIINSFRDFALSALCPGYDAIDAEKAERALKYIDYLKQLEAIIESLTQGPFAENRETVLTLLRMLNPDKEIRDQFKHLFAKAWIDLVKANTPKPASQHIIEAMKQFKADIATKLNLLSRLLMNEMYDAHTEEVSGLPSRELLTRVSEAAVVKLSCDSPAYLGYARKSLAVAPHDFANILHLLNTLPINEYKKEVSARHSELCADSIGSRLSVIEALRNTIENLRSIDRYLARLSEASPIAVVDVSARDVVVVNAVPANTLTSVEPPAYSSLDHADSVSRIVASAPPAYSLIADVAPSTAVDNFKVIPVLSDHYKEIVQKLEAYANAAIEMDDIYIAMQALQAMQEINIIFGGRANLELPRDLRAKLKSSFNRFLSTMISALERIDVSHASIEANQLLLLKAYQLERIRGSAKLYSDFLANSDGMMYPSIHDISLSSYTDKIVHLFGQFKAAAEKIIRSDFTINGFADLNDLFNKMGLLLSLPNEKHALIVGQYEELRRQAADYCLTVRGKLIGAVDGGVNASEQTYNNIAAYLVQLASVPLLRSLGLEQSGEDIISVVVKRTRELCGKLMTVSLRLGDDANIHAATVDHAELTVIEKLFKKHLNTTLQGEIEKALTSYSSKIESTLSSIRNALELRTDANVATKMAQAISMHHYLSECVRLNITIRYTNTIKIQFEKQFKDYALELTKLTSSLLARMAPNVSNKDREAAAAEFMGMLQLLKTVCSQEAGLYAISGDILKAIGRSVANLVVQYREALTKTLLAPNSLGAENTFTNLIARVGEFEQFDEFIKLESREVETFKRLRKRFHNAQNQEHFPKIKDIMQAVYDREYEKAQELMLEEKMFAPGSDMRLVLTEQVDFAIGALTTKIATAIDVIKNQPLNCRHAIVDLLKAYRQIKSADRLVEAQMLSAIVLNDRERLLKDTTTTFDAWTGYCVTSFTNMLKHFDIKSALAAIENYPALVEVMDDMKPVNHATALPQLIEQLATLLRSFGKQFDQSVGMWIKHTSSIPNIARALLMVSEEAYEQSTYGEYWRVISARIATVLTQRCADVVARFKDNSYDMETAISALEETLTLIADMPVESTRLADIVKEQVSQAAEAVTNENLHSKSREQTLRNLKALYGRDQSRQNGVASFKHGQISTYLAEQEQILRTSIVDVLQQGQLPHKLLTDYQQLADSFPKYELFKKGKRELKRMVKEIIDQSLDAIIYNMSLYYEGKNKDVVLGVVQQSLVVLTHAQMLLNNTGDKCDFVQRGLTANVSNATKGIRESLAQNSSRFQSAIAARNVFDLEQPLAVAKAFQSVTTSIQQFVSVCRETDVTQELRDLKQLSNDLAYTPLREQIINAVLDIRRNLEFLQPDTLKEAGSEVRKSYYGELKKNFEFLAQLIRLKEHFDADFLRSFSIESDFCYVTCADRLAAFLSETFRRTFHQLMTTETPTTEVSWTQFHTYYQELTLFVSEFNGHSVLTMLRLKKRDLFVDTRLMQDEDIPASTVIRVITEKFNEYLNNVIRNFHDKFGVKTDIDEYDRELVALLCGLQKMSEDMPALGAIVNEAIRSLLVDVMKSHAADKNFTANIAELLSNEPKGFGASVISSQPVFAGMNDANRNRMTKEQTIEYVVKHLEVHDKRSKVVRGLNSDEASALIGMYKEFMTKYSAKLAEYTAPAKNFAKHKVTLLDDLKRELFNQLGMININYDSKGRIIWNRHITDKVPEIFSYLFLIWTLNVSAGFFDSSNVDNDQDFLKKPHPAQMTALFLMLNMLEQKGGLLDRLKDGNPEILRSKFEEVLTGEGKSVIIASTAAFLCLIGFAASTGCYSDYLSERDAKDFEWFYQFLGITNRDLEQNVLQHGTFNRLSENKLNSHGDLRDLLSNQLFATRKPITVKRPHGRETIALVDEADSLVTAFFGYMYQPYFLYQDELVTQLLDAVWLKHERGALNTIQEIFNIPQFQALIEKHKDLDYIFRLAAVEMLDGLRKYKRKDGHDFYVNNKGEIYYKEFDGTTTNRSKGYETYWACVDRSNNISPLCAASHRGIKVTIGAYSYADLMIGDNYRAMFGVTGTYRQLTPSEKGVVRDVFGIHEEDVSYIPSAYGKNKLLFESGVNFTVVADDEHTLRLAEEILKKRVGWNNTSVSRPVIIFFDTEEELEAFAKSNAFLDIPGKEVVKMTSETITNAGERDSAIKRATRAGTVTLAYREHGRGNDFILKAKQVIANGGCHVIDAFMPETEADQRQHQGRAARQGQDGSFSMVIRKSEILRKFKMSEAEFNQHKVNGELYDKVCEKRNQIFSEKYLELVNERVEMVKTIHEPSMRLMQVLTNPRSTRAEIIEAHKATLPNVEAAVKAQIRLGNKNANILILFDSTGSMGSLIEALKLVLGNVVQALADVLAGAGASFKLQIGHYKDYTETEYFTHTNNWSDDPAELKRFISTVAASGGGNNRSECVELGLFYANKLAKQKEVISHVILIGDEPPTPIDSMADSLSQLPAGSEYKASGYYGAEANKLKVAKIPVSTFFVRTGAFDTIRDPDNVTHTTQRTFKEIADITGGEAGELNLKEPAAAKESVIDLLGKTVTTEVVGGDKSSAAATDLYDKFRNRMRQYN